LLILFYPVEPKQKEPQIMDIGDRLVVQEYFRGFMIFDQFKEVEKVLNLGRIETGVSFIKITFTFLHEILVLSGQFQCFFKIFGNTFLKANRDLEFPVGFAGIQYILQFFFLNLLSSVHGWIIIQPATLVKPANFVLYP